MRVSYALINCAVKRESDHQPAQGGIESVDGDDLELRQLLPSRITQLGDVNRHPGTLLCLGVTGDQRGGACPQAEQHRQRPRIQLPGGQQPDVRQNQRYRHQQRARLDP